MEVLRVENESPPSTPSPLKNIDFFPQRCPKYRHCIFTYIIYIYAQIDVKHIHLYKYALYCVPCLLLRSLGYLFHVSVVYQLDGITFLEAFCNFTARKLLHVNTKRHEFMRMSFVLKKILKMINYGILKQLHTIEILE